MFFALGQPHPNSLAKGRGTCALLPAFIENQGETHYLRSKVNNKPSFGVCGGSFSFGLGDGYLFLPTPDTDFQSFHSKNNHE
jgi:hypothetical protein